MLAIDELLAVLPPAPPLARLDTVPVKALDNYPFVMTHAGSQRGIVRMFAQAGVRPRIVHDLMVNPKPLTSCALQPGACRFVFGDDGKIETASHHTLDCSLCLNATTPPVTQTSAFVAQQPLAMQPLVAAHIAALVCVTLPPGGPPTA